MKKVLGAGLLLCGGLLFAASSELEELRRENTMLRSRLLQSETALRRLRLWMGALSESAEAATPQEREERLLALVAALSQAGSDLALKTANFCDEASKWLRDAQLGAARQAHVSLQLDDLRRLSRKLILLADDSGEMPKEISRSRILALVPSQKLVLLATGSNQGLFPGIIFRCGNVRLIISGTLPEASAAKVIEGDFAELRVGMPVEGGQENPSGKRFFLVPENKKK